MELGGGKRGVGGWVRQQLQSVGRLAAYLVWRIPPLRGGWRRWRARCGLQRGMEVVARRIETTARRREAVTDEGGVGETSFRREI
jgi:hypothetical protein